MQMQQNRFLSPVAFSSGPLKGLPSRVSRPQIMCMAHPRRVARVAKQLEREIGSLLISDKVVQAAVNPRRKMRSLDDEPQEPVLASVTEVHLSQDLLHAKAYLSIFGPEGTKEPTLRRLQGLEGYARSKLAGRLQLRLVPEVRFLLDDSMDEQERLEAVFERVRAIAAGEQDPPPIVL